MATQVTKTIFLAAVLALAATAPALSEDATTTTYAVTECRFVEPPIGPQTFCHIMTMEGNLLIYPRPVPCQAQANELQALFPELKIDCMSKTTPAWRRLQ